MKDFYQGTVYLCGWIRDSIEGNKNNDTIGGTKMISKKDDHQISECNNPACKKLNISKKKKFTIVEGIKLFQIMGSNNTSNLNKSSFWQKIQDSKLIPERTAEQMKRFWTEHENYTVEQWLAKAIHLNLDFSFSLKQIPSPDFVKNFRKKYESEFMRLETLDPVHSTVNNDRIQDNRAHQSSGVSSVYSMNIGRSIASLASQSERGETDHMILKNFDDKRADGATSSAETTANTLVQNSQNTTNLSQTDATSLRKNLFGAIKNIPKNPNPFGANLTHINHIDNTLIEKIPKVEYELDLNDMALPIYSHESRPLETLDQVFERKMSKRLSKFHAKPIDRTQYDKELLQKQLDLEIIKIYITIQDDSLKKAFLQEHGQCNMKPYKRTTTKETNEEGKYQRLISELEETAHQYGIELEKALEIFESVSCSKSHFKKVLEKQSFTTWTEIDDLGLKSKDSPEYAHLLKQKGPEEVERRKAFLGIAE